LELRLSLSLLLLAGCRSGTPATPDAVAPKLSAFVSTTTLLSGDAARVVAGPSGIPQDETSYEANGILPWGPVQAVHTVTVGAQVWTVNQLASPDPFTATYQMPDGRIVVSNDPLETLVAGDGIEPFPVVEVWTSDLGDQWEVVPGRINVYFTSAATEQYLYSLIAAEELRVVFSWFEAEEVREVSLLQSNGQGTLTGGESMSSVSELPNAIAWFDFEFDPQRFASIDDALQHFLALPHVESAIPLIQDYAAGCYPVPNDPIYWGNSQLPHRDAPYYRQSRWIDAYNLTGTTSGVANTPYAGVQQYIAVMDDGVYRAHPDLQGTVATLGVETYDRSYVVGSGRGNPDFATTQPSLAGSKYWRRLQGHGTQIASLIASRANNGVGIPSLAPQAKILPIRMKQWTRTLGLPGVPDEPTFSVNAHVKAVRALRFEFAHGQHAFHVRVVNMSFGYPSFVRNLPWPANFPTGEFKTNVSRDLVKNCRVYVAGAGNDNKQARVYPAAHDNVLGVTGVDYNSLTSVFSYTHRTPQNGGSSNWWPDNITYPVSGVYSEVNGFSFTAITPPLSGYESEFWQHNIWDERLYKRFSGTSAAAPQVSALAYHLFSKKAENGITIIYPPGTAMWKQVTQKITNSANGGDIGPVNGIIKYQNAFNGW
jgi:hypothetical protein